MDRIAKCIYINLERRPDRRAEIENELAKVGLSGERYVGVDKTLGILGCGLSHLGVLKEAQLAEWENVLIFEDDFEFLVSKEVFNEQLQAFWDLDIPWDVLMLSYNITKQEPLNDLIGVIKDAETASGYIVNRHFYPHLINLLESSLPLLESTGQHWIYANDQCWKQLQPTCGWFYFMKRLGKQRGSFSDTAYQYVDRDQ